MSNSLSALDRDLECEACIEPHFQALLSNARHAGWSQDEIANALLSLSQALIAESRTSAFLDALPPAGTTRH